MINESKLRQIQRKSKYLAVLSLVVFFSLIVFSARKLYSIQTQIEQLSKEKILLENQTKDLGPKVTKLKAAQENTLDFLAKATSRSQIKLLAIDDSEWERTKGRLLSLEPGQRQKAVFGAILLAWKDIPFKLGGRSPEAGFDSTTFVEFVLSNAGIEIPVVANKRPSEVMMQMFSKTDQPQPGDLIFYRGNVGSFAMIYLSEGRTNGQGVCVGTFETGQPVQIMDSADFNTPVYPLVGYFKVNYSS